MYFYMYVIDLKFFWLEFCLLWIFFYVYCIYMMFLILLLLYCRCIINCKEKLVVIFRMNVLVECMDCIVFEFLMYWWILEENVNGVWIFIDFFLKMVNGKFIILNFNVVCFCFF